MPLTLLQIVILGVIQGFTELLPVSSSAHVIVAEKLMGLDPSSPAMTFLLAMLHTGTMFAVIVYFWSAWQKSFGSNPEQVRSTIGNLALATVYTLAIGVGLQVLIEKGIAFHGDKTEIEDLFSNLTLVAAALAAGGLLIIFAGLRHQAEEEHDYDIPLSTAGWIGAVQGLAIPFRGFSRSGATISVGLLLSGSASGMPRSSASPSGSSSRSRPSPRNSTGSSKRNEVLDSPVPEPRPPAGCRARSAMVTSFVAGLVALRLLDPCWLGAGRWQYFGFYCLGGGRRRLRPGSRRAY